MSPFFEPFPTRHTKTQEHPLLRQYFIVVICSVVVDCSVENGSCWKYFQLKLFVLSRAGSDALAMCAGLLSSSVGVFFNVSEKLSNALH